MVVARTHATELSQLHPQERMGYLDEMCRLAHVLEMCFQPRKLNYELLGNQVPHLHWHLFPRRADDADALKPVWLALDRAERNDTDRRRLETGSISRAETTALIRTRLREVGV